MLHIYDPDNIPKDLKAIKFNDLFFSVHTILIDDAFCKLVLSYIDSAGYIDTMTFKSRSDCFGPLDKDRLSTGAKTLLNIYQNPNFCFNVVECGTNAIELLPLIKEGNIYTTSYFNIYLNEFNRDCAILYRDKEFYKTRDFIDFYNEMYDLEHPEDL